MILKNTVLKILLIMLISITFNYTSALEKDNTTENIQENYSEALKNLDIEYKKNIFIEDNININIENLKRDLDRIYPNESFTFEWNITGAPTRNGEVIDLKFEKAGEKNIDLNVFLEGKELIYTKNINVLVYEKSFPILIQEGISDLQLDNLVEYSKNEGTFSYYELIKKDNISELTITDLIENYRKIEGVKSSYIVLWGDKEFLSNVISKMTKEINSQNSHIKYNIILVSPYNINLLNDYLKNFIVEKTWLQKILIVNEASISNILKETSNVSALKEVLISNGFELLDVDLTPNGIHKALFISKFINNLSNEGFQSKGIYLIIMIPFLFTVLVIFKHLIGLSPIGVLIPIGLTILIFNIGILATIIVFAFFVILNVLISKILNKETLLYTPKISFLLIINIIGIILLLNTMYYYDIITLNLNNSLYIILYIIILEKMINIILSKEFNEFRSGLTNSILIALVSYIIFSQDIVTTFILSYPETILLLLPINYIIGKFSGLRVTEYFRFREVIKTVEEE